MLYFKLCKRKRSKMSRFSDKSWNKSHLHQTVVLAALCPGVGFICTTSLYNCSLLMLPGSVVESGYEKGWFIMYRKTCLSPREHLTWLFGSVTFPHLNWPLVSLAFQCHHCTLQPVVAHSIICTWERRRKVIFPLVFTHPLVHCLLEMLFEFLS